MPRDPKAGELRSVAPLLALGDKPKLVGPVTLVANGERIVGVTSAELLRPYHGTPLAIATKLDGSSTIPVANWGMGRYSGLGLVELHDATAFPLDHDVTPLAIGAVRATPETRGAPAGIVAIVADADAKYRRELVGVHVDNDDGGGMSDYVTRIASPLSADDARVPVEGCPVFVWFPPDPALGRPSEVLVVALVQPYRAQTAQPRDTPVIGELVGLDDLGRALISVPEPDERPELAQVAGEIDDVPDTAT